MSSTVDFEIREHSRGLPGRIARFPFPFPRDTYRYSTNVEPAGSVVDTAAGRWGEHPVDIDGYYLEDLAERERVLGEDPTRFQALPHMEIAQWDAMITLMRMLADADPRTFSLDRKGGIRRFTNRALDVEQAFVFGERSTLPEPPLRFIGRHIQEDVVLLDQRDNALWGDAGLVTFAADWSLRFDVGMSFLQIHGPVPRVHTEGVIPRAQHFLMGLQAGQRYRRTNWSLTVDRRLDQSTETYPQWGRDRRLLAEGPLEDVGRRLNLRVEVQHLVRLGASGALMFLIRTYLLPFEDIARVPEWSDRLYRVLDELPEDMADYKGVTRTREPGLRWLRTYGGVQP
ncbi:heme-dependent oxidative N-demethylase family protein [Rhodococcus coprophilus]|uniref:heme-dependent oxidative N-demethylase family protein n=1 Tax=Rhodococcus coprophilus TaxID=38310 RepID=UPI0033D99DE6